MFILSTLGNISNVFIQPRWQVHAHIPPANITPPINFIYFEFILFYLEKLGILESTRGGEHQLDSQSHQTSFKNRDSCWFSPEKISIILKLLCPLLSQQVIPIPTDGLPILEAFFTSAKKCAWNISKQKGKKKKKPHNQKKNTTISCVQIFVDVSQCEAYSEAPPK